MPRYRITINGRDKAAMVDLVRKHQIRVSDHGIRHDPDKGYTVHAFAAADQIRKLRRIGYAVDQHEDADRAGKARQREVGRGNRYTQADPGPAAGYLNVAEVEAAVIKAAAPPYSEIAELVVLPEKTCERRQCHALKIGKGGGANRPGVYFLGGVHGREWGSCDILIRFIESVEQAWLKGVGLSFGPKTFSAAEIRSIVDTLDVVIFPQANPDGRLYSMTTEHVDWRKNRRPTPALRGCPGVDINRNYDFLWDFRKYFNADYLPLTSTDQCDEYYNGRQAFSEPETRNARWIADRFANIRFFIDLHSFGPQILYRWGDAPDQTKDPEKNFRNPCWNNVRGIAHRYQEYLPERDLEDMKSLSEGLRDGIKAVRGTDYIVESSWGLYATAGASDDYFYSRHITDPGQAKILSWTLEWGSNSFHPPWKEMQPIIEEVIAGLLTFCLQIVATTRVQGTV